MPDLSTNDAAQIAEAARQAGVLPARAHLFTRATDLSTVPRDAGGQLDAAALAAAVGVAVADAPELTVAGWAPTTSGPRRAPNPYGLAGAHGAVQGAVRSSPDATEAAKVEELVGRMYDYAGIRRPGATS